MTPSVVVDADAISHTDTDGADILSELAEELAPAAPRSHSPEHPQVLELWRRAGVMDAVGADRVFETVRDDVVAVNGRTRVTAVSALPRPVRCLTDLELQSPAARLTAGPPDETRPRQTPGAAAAPATDRADAARPSRRSSGGRHPIRTMRRSPLRSRVGGTAPWSSEGERGNCCSISRTDLAGWSHQSAPAFELLESKLRPPHGRGGTVSRAKLIGRWKARARRRSFSSARGPGWGKTTLLAQWAAGSQRPFAWVSVDERDNDPIVLLTYVAAALDRVSPLDPGVFEALASPGASVEGTVVPRLGAALAAMDAAVVLVLDDLHLLDEPGMPRRHGGAHATRVGGLAAGALHARRARRCPWERCARQGLALEIGPDDLRMTEAEARQLLGAAGVDLPDDQVAELTEHTEGWSAGLYLAALSIRAQRIRADGAATFSGSDRLVSDYLESELLAHLSATSFASSRGPPFSSGCPDRSATRFSRRAARRRCSSRWRAPTCSWCRWTPLGSGTGTTISSRSCSVRS